MNRLTTVSDVPVAIPIALPVAALNEAADTRVLARQGANRDGTPLILRGHTRIRCGQVMSKGGVR